MDGGGRFTRLSKVLSGLLLLLFALCYVAPSTRQYLALVPGRTLPCVWNLITAPFVTTNIVEVLLDVAALLLLARLVEPVYGSTEFLRLIGVVSLSASLATFAAAYVIFLSAPYERKGRTLYAEFCGFHGVVGALLVAVKQISPDHEAALAGGSVRLRARYFPGAYVLIVAVVACALQAWRALAFLLLGTYSGWVYLRWFQRQPETALRGDPSEDFRLASLFPDALAAPVDAVGAAFATVLRLKHEAPADAKPLLPTAAAHNLLGSSAADANRRRERGAKALQERLEARSKVAAAGGAGGAAGAEGAAGGEDGGAAAAAQPAPIESAAAVAAAAGEP